MANTDEDLTLRELAKADRTKRPNLLIAGAARSGTTALSESLARHSSIRMCVPKEVHFFIHANTPPTYTGPGDEVMMSKVVTDPEAFLGLYSGAVENYRAEGSVSTLYWPERSIPNIEQFCESDVKVICLLRNPVMRAHSAFLYLRSRGYEPLDNFEEALDVEQKRIDAGYHHMWHYEAMSRYDQQLPAFVDAFGDRLHVMVFEEFRRDPVNELSRLCRFLDIGVENGMLIETDINRGGEVRSPTLARVIDAARSAPLIRDATVRLVPRVMRDRLRAKNLHRPQMDNRTLRLLEQRLAPATTAVETILDRSLPSWHEHTFS